MLLTLTFTLEICTGIFKVKHLKNNVPHFEINPESLKFNNYLIFNRIYRTMFLIEKNKQKNTHISLTILRSRVETIKIRVLTKISKVIKKMKKKIT